MSSVQQTTDSEAKKEVTFRFCNSCRHEQDASTFRKIGKAYKCGICADNISAAMKGPATLRDAYGTEVTRKNKAFNKTHRLIPV